LHKDAGYANDVDVLFEGTWNAHALWLFKLDKASDIADDADEPNRKLNRVIIRDDYDLGYGVKADDVDSQAYASSAAATSDEEEEEEEEEHEENPLFNTSLSVDPQEAEEHEEDRYGLFSD